MGRPKKTDSSAPLRFAQNDGGEAEALDRWEIRRGRTVYVVSHLEDCGYTDAALESLRKAGYSLYKNGKCIIKGRTT